MKFLYHTLSRFRVNDHVMVIRVTTDGQTLTVTMRSPDDAALPEIPLSIGYNGTVQQMTRPTPAEMRATFPYADAVKRIDLHGATVVYRERSVSSLSWQGGLADPDPEVSVVIDGVRLNESNTVRVVSETAGAPGLNLRLVEVCCFDRDPGQTAWTHRVYAYDSAFQSNPYGFYAGADMEPGTEVWFRMLYACYVPADESDHDAYLGLVEIDTERAVVTAAGSPYCPREVRVANAAAGANARVSWVLPPDTTVPISGIELERSVDGGAYTAVTSGLVTSYVDRLPASMTDVTYRVRSVSASAGGTTSPWVTASPAAEEASNVRVRIGGAWKTVAGIWVGVNGTPAPAKKTVLVGHG